MKNGYILTALILSLGHGCGGEGGMSAAEVKQSYETYCDDFVARCPERRNYADAQDCKDSWPCTGTILRADMLVPLIMCLDARACTDADDRCYELATHGLAPTSKAKDVQAECQARLTACQNEGVQLGAEVCGWSTMRDDVLAQIQPCYAKPCAEVESCADMAFRTAAPACADDR